MRTLSLLLCTMALAGCRRELDLPQSSEVGKIVLIGELTAGENFSIRGGGSAPIAAGSKLSAPDGLTLTITDGDGNTATAAGEKDALSTELHTVALQLPLEVRSGHRYSLVARHQSLGEATASLIIPGPFSASVTDTARTSRGGSALLRATIRLDDGPGDNFYVIEAVKQPMQVRNEFFFAGSWRDRREYRAQYDSLKAAGVSFAERSDTTLGNRNARISIYTSDAATENSHDGGSVAAYRRVLLSDRSFAGRSYTTAVELDRGLFVGSSEADRGRVLFQIKSVSKEYFDFLVRYERQAPSAAGDLSSLGGNVVGGFGAVGGVVKQEWVWVFDSWE